MRLVTFAEPITVQYAKSTGGKTHLFAPGQTYVVTERQFEDLKDWYQFMTRTSVLDARTANFNVHSPKGSVLFYAGSGGFGDQLMAAPVAKILSEHGFDVQIATEPGNEVCWWMFPWIGGVHTFPMEYGLWRSNTVHHAVFESVTNLDEHPGQLHPVDTLLSKLGIDPEAITAARKVVQPLYTRREIQLGMERGQGKQVALFQLCASQASRSLSPDQCGFLLKKLAKAYPQFNWVAVCDRLTPVAYAESAKRAGVEVRSYSHLRELFVAVCMAKCVIAPDSLLVHLAGVHQVPCVGLWGMTNPALRTCYYLRHVPIFLSDACPAAPCQYAGTGLPPYCPPAQGKRETCACLEQVSFESIQAALDQALR